MKANFLLLSLIFLCLIGISQTQIGPTINGLAAGDLFGNSVAISNDGQRILVGGPSNDGNAVNAGHVRVFENIAGSWTQIGNPIMGLSTNNGFGVTVDFSADGKRFIAGAPGYNGNDPTGMAWVFEEVNGNWTPVHHYILGENVGDAAGHGVAISDDGTRIAVSSIYNDFNANNCGHVRVFDEVQGGWTQVGSAIVGTNANDWFGRSISFSSDGNRLAIGSPYFDGKGVVSIFEQSGIYWPQVGSDILGAGGSHGERIALSGSGKRVIIGAKTHDGTLSYCGHASIYEEINGAWTLVGTPIEGTAENDLFGKSVAITPNGKRVAIGGDYAGNYTVGYVKVFQENGGIWSQIGPRIDGDNFGYEFGSSVSISANGTRLVVGGARADDIGRNSGHAKVFYSGSPVAVENIISPEMNTLQPSPNPTNGKFTFVNKEMIVLSGKIELTILNQLGQTILINQYESSEDLFSTEFSLAGNTPGVYIVQIKEKAGIRSMKIVYTN